MTLTLPALLGGKVVLTVVSSGKKVEVDGFGVSRI
jgi:hypothetical protein